MSMSDPTTPAAPVSVSTPALLETLIESAPIALIVSDARGNMRLVNREVETLFGYRRDELLGRSIELLVPQPFRAGHGEMRRKYLVEPSARHMGVGRELFAQRKDGTLVPVEIGLKPIHAEGQPLVLSVIADITERKSLEDAVRRANEALEQRVHERTAQLELASREKEVLLEDLRRQREELDRLSREDPLTGISNRRDFDQRLDAEIARAARLGSPLAVAMLDLDRFKLVNDRFGHALGDAALRQTADLMRHQCRAIESIGRYGGEEFALALPGTDLAAAMVLCERIRHAFELFDWSPLDPRLMLTVSAGVAAWRPGLDAAAVLAQADAHLYEAKRRGRNRVVPAAADLVNLDLINRPAGETPR
jgi:diguanylate cyclase (GGDEF)-like protein/PAS domain S-box-containing protein